MTPTRRNDTLGLAKAAQGFAAAGSEPRLEVLRVLVRAGPDGLTVGEIQERVGQPASTLAHHLRCLATGGLIEQERRGRSVLNRAAHAHIEGLAAFLLHACCAEAKPEQARGALSAAYRKLTH